jgi:hypothetical protein
MRKRERSTSKLGGEPLTAGQVEGLPDGTEVEIIWSGGNGPHRYRIQRDRHGVVRIDNIYRDQIGILGRHPLTEVRVVPPEDVRGIV